MQLKEVWGRTVCQSRIAAVSSIKPPNIKLTIIKNNEIMNYFVTSYLLRPAVSTSGGGATRSTGLYSLCINELNSIIDTFYLMSCFRIVLLYTNVCTCLSVPCSMKYLKYSGLHSHSAFTSLSVGLYRKTNAQQNDVTLHLDHECVKISAKIPNKT